MKYIHHISSYSQISNYVPPLGTLPEKDVELVRRFLPENFAFNHEDYLTIRAIAFDNLITRDARKFDLETFIKPVAKLCNERPGLRMTYNHEISENDKVWGRVYRMVLFECSPEMCPSWRIDLAGQTKYNRKIIQEEGYWLAVISIVAKKTDCLFDKIDRFKIFELSIGGFHHTSYLCPECKQDFRIPCARYKGNCYPALPYSTELALPFEKPYYILGNVLELFEVSGVTVPAFANATLI